jgi:predicted alpha/beta hydrolase family esterase
MSSYRVVLIHGYNKTEKDMHTLGEYLAELDYKVEYLNLPLLFEEIEHSVSHLKEFLFSLQRSGVNKREEIILIGHSTGGLVIRGALSDKRIRRIVDKVVLVACPNLGCKLADLAKKYLPFMGKIFKTLKSLERENIENLNVYKGRGVDIAAIAGSESNLFLGRFLNDKNDGRIEVDEVMMGGLKDFLILPLGHKEIHKRIGTATYINNFIKRSSFYVD